MPSPAERVASPYDPAARYSTKRTVEWIGYKVHLTEPCDPATPRLIVNVETTPATTPDDQMLATIHASLKPRALLPSAARCRQWLGRPSCVRPVMSAACRLPRRGMSVATSVPALADSQRDVGG